MLSARAAERVTTENDIPVGGQGEEVPSEPNVDRAINYFNEVGNSLNSVKEKVDAAIEMLPKEAKEYISTEKGRPYLYHITQDISSLLFRVGWLAGMLEEEYWKK